MKNGLNQIVISQTGEDFKKHLSQLRQKIVLSAGLETDTKRDAQLKEIISQVRLRQDEAVAEFTEKFDGVTLKPSEFLVPEKELKKAHNEIEPALLKSIRKAIANVCKYQKAIFIGKNKIAGIKYTPLKRVGICIPGASAPLPSTVIMTAVPARIAGVREIAVISPPRFQGSIHPVILAVCRELGITEVYRIGGAQAVAALAFGTESIKKVDKIVGPGSTWVQLAKKEVFGFVDIDSIAGPSEVLIIANGKANPAWIAADMLSQAEHAPGSAVVFTDSKEQAESILNELKIQVEQLGRSKETIDCLLRYSGIAIFKNMTDLIDAANDFASEHLEIQCGNKSREIAKKIENAGAIFIGGYTPVAVGDYWAGPSHTLPTGQTAKFFSPLSSNDFVKSTSIIEYGRKKLEKSADDIIRLAKSEGLDAHARSVEIRRQKQ